MTLLEVVIASAILVIVALLAYMVVFSASTFRAEQASTEAIADHRRALQKFCKNEFLSARFGDAVIVDDYPYPLGIYSGNAEIRYRIPCGRGPGGHITFGYVSPLPGPHGGPTPGLACFLRFEADEALLESVASPVASPTSSLQAPFPGLPQIKSRILNADLNDDGGLEDTFLRGSVVKYSVAPNGHPLLEVNDENPVLDRVKISNYALLAVNPADVTRFNGDVDGSGEPDPLFQFVDEVGDPVSNLDLASRGVAVVVKIWTGIEKDDGTDFVLNSNISWTRIRNAQ